MVVKIELELEAIVVVVVVNGVEVGRMTITDKTLEALGVNWGVIGREVLKALGVNWG